jgi:hypothetical protein
LEGVAEWDEMVAEIEQRVCPRLTGKSAPEIKNILNAAIREEIKNPTTQAGRIVKETLESQLGKPASESFSSQGTIFRWDKPGKPPTK